MASLTDGAERTAGDVMSKTAYTTYNLTTVDLALFEKIKVPIGLLEVARIRRVTDAEARDLGIVRQRSSRLEGILFPYMRPSGEVVGYRLRRDHPEMDAAGRPK